MFAILHALGMFVVGLFKSRCRLEAENSFSVTSLISLCDGYLCVPKTSSGIDFRFGRRNSLFLRQNSLFRKNNSLFG
jgi:hypothetical protein